VHKHIWGKWYPFDKSTKYRVCLDPKCKLVEKKKVTG
jgi:hypothetical protein